MRCNARIQIDKKGYVESYCQLSTRHEGEHSLESGPQDLRCPATKDGRQCSQPIGHFGNHGIVVGAVIEKSW